MTSGIDERSFNVLLAEDNPGDVELTRRTIESSKYPCNLWVAEDGEAAMAFLHKQGEYATAPRPDLIILDLAMPKKDGYEVLDELQPNPSLSSIPVMILTAPRTEKDRLESYGIHPARYCQKPLALDRFERILSGIKEAEFRTEGVSPTPS